MAIGTNLFGVSLVSFAGILSLLRVMFGFSLGVLSSACKRCMMIDFEGHPEV